MPGRGSARAREGFSVSELGIGAATEIRRTWPAHVFERCDSVGVFVGCQHCGALRYVTEGPIKAGAANDACWAFALVHENCKRVPR